MPGITVNVPKGAFYVYPNVGASFAKGVIKSPMQFAEKLLAEAHVAVVPGEAFGTDQHIRISYATSHQELERGLDRIQEFLAAQL
jgi:aspartate aminotransferase